jgi:hypothetical protein
MSALRIVRLVFKLWCQLMKYSVNLVVPGDQLLSTAIEWARQITQNSPDAVQSTKRALIEAAKNGNVEQATFAHVWSAESGRSYRGENLKVSLPLETLENATIHMSCYLSRRRGSGHFRYVTYDNR